MFQVQFALWRHQSAVRQHYLVEIAKWNTGGKFVVSDRILLVKFHISI